MAKASFGERLNAWLDEPGPNDAVGEVVDAFKTETFDISLEMIMKNPEAREFFQKKEVEYLEYKEMAEAIGMLRGQSSDEVKIFREEAERVRQETGEGLLEIFARAHY